jgi:hypothetical protein
MSQSPNRSAALAGALQTADIAAGAAADAVQKGCGAVPTAISKNSTAARGRETVPP